MAIKGLTDKGGSFPQIGILRKGAPKPESGNKPGADLKYFRFDADDEEVDGLFAQAYGAEPTSIRVFVPFPSTSENFDAWKEEWTASSLKHRCDGETCVRWLTPQGTYSDQPKPCPGGCKQVGRLKVVIPELRRLAYVTVQTTSIHDIMQIDQNLRALEALRGSLQGIPLMLKRVPREISTPAGDGKRARREKWLITVEAQPSWVDLQLTAQERAALPSGGQLALPPGPDDDDEDDSETIGEVPVRHATDQQYHGDVEAALKAIWLQNGKAEKDWPKYHAEKVAPLSLEAKRTMLDKWQKAALKATAAAASAEVHQGEVVEEAAI